METQHGVVVVVVHGSPAEAGKRREERGKVEKMRTLAIQLL
jgi:hypothetical protein